MGASTLASIGVFSILKWTYVPSGDNEVAPNNENHHAELQNNWRGQEEANIYKLTLENEGLGKWCWNERVFKSEAQDSDCNTMSSARILTGTFDEQIKGGESAKTEWIKAEHNSW